jgi:hypothetical protein
MVPSPGATKGETIMTTGEQAKTTIPAVTESDMELVLEELMNENDDKFPLYHSVRSFRDAGVLTRNAGLVLRLDDGSEFQITIVKSR